VPGLLRLVNCSLLLSVLFISRDLTYNLQLQGTILGRGTSTAISWSRTHKYNVDMRCCSMYNLQNVLDY